MSKTPRIGFTPVIAAFTHGICLSIGILGYTTVSALPGLAQITADTSLGATPSVVNPGSLINGSSATLIEGGAARGANLFHSFTDFNVEANQQVYFANPSAIENILTRVTGGSVSNIDGTLGVDGNANLFLLNPNGVIFGPGASLDINGSFTTSTAGSFAFADGSEFRAIPQVGELFSASVPLGVQFNHPSNAPQGNITSTGILETGQDLTLAGDNLYLEGQLLTGGDLTLLAEDTVTIRDTATDAFIANAGGNLTVQGNQEIDIWTLQHLEQTPFVSGGDLRLVSDGIISGDAHFASGGSLLLLTLDDAPGNFVSFYDPIISANGNVIFGDYTGVALKVEATGSIQGGNIRITGPDTTFTADGSGSDIDLLASSRAAILRAGVNAVGTTNVPQGTTFAAGTVVGQPSGSIIVGSINTSTDNNTIDNGGPIILEAAGNITAGNLNASSASTAGSITLKATGNIRTSNLNASSFSPSEDVGNIFIYSRSGDIQTDDLNTSNLNDSGRGGDITLRAANHINIENLDSSAFSPTQSSGKISIDSSTGNIQTQRLSTGNLDGGNGGEIMLEAAGNITTGNLESFSFSDDNANNGGNISIESTTGSIGIGEVTSYSISSLGSAGNAGAVSIVARAGSIQETRSPENILAYSSGAIGSTTGTGGNITLQAQDTISNLTIRTFSSNGRSGDVNIQGSGNLTLQNIILATNNTEASGNNQTVQVRFSQSGDVTINSTGNLTLNNSRITSNTNSPESAGSIKINSPGEILLTGQSDVNSDSNSSGRAGNIEITAGRGLSLQDSSIAAETTTSGEGGNITLRTPNITLVDSDIDDDDDLDDLDNDDEDGPDRRVDNNDLTSISAGTSSSQQGGNITVISNTPLTIQGPGQLAVTSENEESGQAGNINITAPLLILNDRVQLSASSESSEGGGVINLNVDDAIVLRRRSLIVAQSNSRDQDSEGGNIAINTRFLVAVPDENNDIIANAVAGDGGEIEVNANTILGLIRQERLTAPQLRKVFLTSDLSASSEGGIQGDIVLNTLDVDPSQGLTELPADLSDRTNQITAGCGISNNDSQSEFVITGRGGLPPSPNDPATSNQINTPWVTYADTDTDDTMTTPETESTAPLVEAQQITLDANGNAYFVAHGLPVTTACAATAISQH